MNKKHLYWITIKCKRCGKDVIKIREGTKNNLYNTEIICYECRKDKFMKR